MANKIENIYFSDIIEYLKENKLERDGCLNWCYPRRHPSGRDYFDLIPISYITEKEEEELIEAITEEFELEYDAIDNYYFTDIIVMLENTKEYE